MRLSDTIFLTLTICLLQVYIGMRCLYEVRCRPAHLSAVDLLTQQA